MTTKHRTLAAIDFSPPSIAALDFARVLARKEPDTTVVAMHAMTLPTAQLAAADVIVARDFELRWRRDLDTAMRDLVDQRRGEPAIEGRIVAGPAARALVDEAREHGVSRIVLGSSGRSALPRWLLGSVTDRVLRTSPVDVVVVPAPSADAKERTAIRRVLCAIDFSAASEIALQRAAAIASAHDASLHVMHVWNVAPYVDRIPELRVAIARDLELQLDAVAYRHQSPGLRIERRLTTGHAAGEIVAFARGLDVDLVVVGTGNKDTTDRFLVGSISERVVRTASVPVLVAHATRDA